MCGAALAIFAFPFFVAAIASPPSVSYEAEMRSYETLSAAHLARLDMTQFFKRFFTPFFSPSAPTLAPNAPAQETVPRDSLSFVFRDKKTNQPILHMGVSFTDMSVCTCPRGALCKPCAARIFYEGTTDGAGAVTVSRSSFERISAFNLVVAGGYFGVNFSRSGNRYTDSLKLSRFDVVRDSSATIIIEPVMDVEERLRLIEKANPDAQRLPGSTPQERLQEMLREAERQKSSAQPPPSPAASSKEEQMNVFLKAVEEAQQKAATQGSRPSGPREPSPEEINKIIELFKEAARKAAQNRVLQSSPQPIPTPTSTLVPASGRPASIPPPVSAD